MGWVTTYGIQFVVTVVTARLLAPELFGLVALVLVIIGIAELLAEAGTYAAIIQFDEVEGVVASALIAVPLAGLIGSLALAAGSWWIAALFGIAEIQPVALALSGVLFLVTLGVVPQALLARRFDVRALRAIVHPFSILAYGGVVIVLALLGAGVWSLVAGQYVGALVMLVGSWYLARPLRGAGRPSRRAWRRVRRYGRSLLLATMLETIREQLVTVVVGRSLGTTAAGLWAAGLRLAQLPITGITHIVGSVVFPALSRLQDDLERLRARFLESLWLIAMLIVPVCAVAGALGEPLVALLFGERWRGAGQVLAILAAWALLLSGAEAARELFKARGRTAIVAKIAVAEAAALVAIIAVLLGTGNASLLSLACAPVASAAVALVLAARALGTTAGIGARDLWRAFGTAVVAGSVQFAVMLMAVQAIFRGIGGWWLLGDQAPGAIASAIALVAIGGIGFAVFLAVSEAVDRGSVRRLMSIVREVTGAARRPDPDDRDDGDAAGDGSRVPEVG